MASGWLAVDPMMTSDLGAAHGMVARLRRATVLLATTCLLTSHFGSPTHGKRNCINWTRKSCCISPKAQYLFIAHGTEGEKKMKYHGYS